MMKNSWDYPGLWSMDEIIEQSTHAGVFNKKEYDALFQLHCDVRTSQYKDAKRLEILEKIDFVYKERKKVGRITKRWAPTGYVAVSKPLARKMYESGCDVTLCGNNVSSYHVFGGWHLGCTINRNEENKTDYNGVPVDFQTIVNGYISYNLGSELGTYAVYYVKKENL